MTGQKTFLIIVVIILVLIVILSLVPVFFGKGKTNAPEEKIEEPLGATLYKSGDAGITWKLLGKFPGGNITNMVFDASGAKRLMLGTKMRGVWKGDLNGDKFEQYPGGVGETSHIFDLIKPVTENEFIALVSFLNRGRIVKYKDGDRKELFFTPLDNYAFVKGYQTRSGFLRVIGSDGGFYESRNKGETWRISSRFQSGLQSMIFNPSNEDEIWVIDPRGSMYRSRDGGSSWANITDSLKDFSGSKENPFIFIDPRTQFLYHGSRHGLLRSTNHGASWDRINLTIAPEVLPITAIAIDPQDSAKIYVAALNQLYITTDGGVTWRGIEIAKGVSITSILINPVDYKEIFIGTKII